MEMSRTENYATFKFPKEDYVLALWAGPESTKYRLFYENKILFKGTILNRASLIETACEILSRYACEPDDADTSIYSSYNERQLNWVKEGGASDIGYCHVELLGDIWGTSSDYYLQ